MGCLAISRRDRTLLGHNIISIAMQAGAFVLFIHWRAEPSGAPHPARALGRAGDFFLHWRVCPFYP
jgi:hypothetical protein